MFQVHAFGVTRRITVGYIQIVDAHIPCNIPCKVGRVHLCWVEGNTVWSHMASYTP